MEFAKHLQRFGLSRFRPGQQEVIETVLAGQDCLCVMPTGGGKSLCYQLPSVVGEGLTVVVSPLIALMKDQVDGLRQRGIHAACINSSMSLAEQAECLRTTESGGIDLLYIAPERCRSVRFQEVIAKADVRLLAVDEAHCISEWGHDFRPDYARLGQLRKKLGGPPTIALTATATPEVRQDVITQLALTDPRIFVTGFARDNLAFESLIANGQREKELLLLEALRALQDGGAIVYCTTRKLCEQVTELLRDALGRPIGVYHAGLENEQRRGVQDEFMAGDLDIIVATNAFGMGIDRGDLRLVVHFNIPGSLEAYYQEAGRAGRDGLPARCLLLYSYQDRYIHEYFIENAHPGREILRDVYEFLRASPQDPVEITQQEVKEALCLSVGAECVGAAEQILERCGALRRLNSQHNKASFWFDTDSPTLVDLIPREARNQRKVLRALDTLAGDQRQDRVSLSLEQVAAVSQLEREPLTRALRELTKHDWFDYAPPFRGRAIHLVNRARPFGLLDVDFAQLERRKQAEYAKLERVVRYAQTRGCRQQEFLEYFGQHDRTVCGVCDNCRAGGRVRPPTARQAIDAQSLNQPIRMALSGVARGGGRFGKQVIAQMLCGSQSAKLSRWKLDQLSTFGLLRHCTQAEATQLLDELIRLQLVQSTEVDRFKRVVHLTQRGAQVMRGLEQLSAPLHLPAELIQKFQADADEVHGGLDSTEVGDDPSAARAAASGDDPQAVAQLRRWRRDQAASENVPAYRVLTNAALERIVQTRPRSLDELEHIKGVGPATLGNYGPAILQALAPPVAALESAPVPADQAIVEKPALPESAPGQAAGSSVVVPASDNPRPSYYWTWRLLADGYSVQECQQIRGLSPRRLRQELDEAATAGLEVAPCWLPPAEPEGSAALDAAPAADLELP